MPESKIGLRDKAAAVFGLAAMTAGPSIISPWVESILKPPALSSPVPEFAPTKLSPTKTPTTSPTPTPVPTEKPRVDSEQETINTLKRIQQVFGFSPEMRQDILRRVRVESDFDRDAVSKSGAVGLGQITPATAETVLRYWRANPQLGEKIDQYGFDEEKMATVLKNPVKNLVMVYLVEAFHHEKLDPLMTGLSAQMQRDLLTKAYHDGVFGEKARLEQIDAAAKKNPKLSREKEAGQILRDVEHGKYGPEMKLYLRKTNLYEVADRFLAKNPDANPNKIRGLIDNSLKLNKDKTLDEKAFVGNFEKLLGVKYYIGELDKP